MLHCGRPRIVGCICALGWGAAALAALAACRFVGDSLFRVSQEGVWQASGGAVLASTVVMVGVGQWLRRKTRTRKFRRRLLRMAYEHQFDLVAGSKSTGNDALATATDQGHSQLGHDVRAMLGPHNKLIEPIDKPFTLFIAATTFGFQGVLVAIARLLHGMEVHLADGDVLGEKATVLHLIAICGGWCLSLLELGRLMNRSATALPLHRRPLSTLQFWWETQLAGLWEQPFLLMITLPLLMAPAWWGDGLLHTSLSGILGGILVCITARTSWGDPVGDRIDHRPTSQLGPKGGHPADARLQRVHVLRLRGEPDGPESLEFAHRHPVGGRTRTGHRVETGPSHRSSLQQSALVDVTRMEGGVEKGESCSALIPKGAPDRGENNFPELRIETILFVGFEQRIQSAGGFYFSQLPKS